MRIGILQSSRRASLHALSGGLPLPPGTGQPNRLRPWILQVLRPHGTHPLNSVNICSPWQPSKHSVNLFVKVCFNLAGPTSRLLITRSHRCFPTPTSCFYLDTPTSLVSHPGSRHRHPAFLYDFHPTLVHTARHEQHRSFDQLHLLPCGILLRRPGFAAPAVRGRILQRWRYHRLLGLPAGVQLPRGLRERDSGRFGMSRGHLL